MTLPYFIRIDFKSYVVVYFTSLFFFEIVRPNKIIPFSLFLYICKYVVTVSVYQEGHDQGDAS